MTSYAHTSHWYIKGSANSSNTTTHQANSTQFILLSHWVKNYLSPRIKLFKDIEIQLSSSTQRISSMICGSYSMIRIVLVLWLAEHVYSFTNWSNPIFGVNVLSQRKRHHDDTFRSIDDLTSYTVVDAALFAKKKKGKAPVAANLDFDLFDDEPMSKKDQMKAQKKVEKEEKKVTNDRKDAFFDLDSFDDDEPMSKKDQMKAQKKTAKEAKKAAKEIEPVAAFDLDSFDDDEPMSMKDQLKAQKKAAKEAKKAGKQDTKATTGEEEAPAEKKDRKAAALKALEEMERMEAEMAMNSSEEEQEPKLSKKEAKEAAKKAAKEAAKKAAKEAKKAAKRAAAGDVDEGSGIDLSVSSTNDSIEEIGSPNVSEIMMCLSILLCF